jgi:TRAP-type C4-dicarboxylate transport system permease small subunit
MRGFLQGYGRLLDRIGWVERGVGVAMLALMVGCIFAQVVSRYCFGRPLVWVEELSTYAFIWGVFVGASLGLKQGRHIRILSFVDRLSAQARRVFHALTSVAIIVLCVLLAANGFRAMALFEWGQTTIALPVELPRFLFYSTPLILGTASMAFTATHDLLEVLRLGGPPGPRPEEAAG